MCCDLLYFMFNLVRLPQIINLVNKESKTLAAKYFVRNQQSAASVFLLQELPTFLPSHKMI